MLVWLRSLANAFLGRSGKPDRVDTATRMALDGDFSGRGEPSAPERDPAPDVDPLAELVRIINEPGPEPKPKRRKAQSFPRRRLGGQLFSLSASLSPCNVLIWLRGRA